MEMRWHLYFLLDIFSEKVEKIIRKEVFHGNFECQ